MTSTVRSSIPSASMQMTLIPVNVKFPFTRVIVIMLKEILVVLRRKESSKIKRLLNNTT